jgi:hypothetical protein
MLAHAVEIAAIASTVRERCMMDASGKRTGMTGRGTVEQEGRLEDKRARSNPEV